MRTQLEDHQALVQEVLTLEPQIEQAAQRCLFCLQNGRKLLLAGNGGSAADAQHLAAEFVGRFLRKRPSLAAIALTTDTSALTAIANDFGFEEVFSRQLIGLGQAGDVLLAISTSGNSPNVIKAAEAARQKGITVIGLLGNDGGKLKAACELAIVVPSQVTARIQEMHILIGHLICDYVDQAYA